MTSEAIPWKVIYVASRQEKKVAVLLEKNEFIFYLPMQKTLRNWSDRKKWVDAPVFNGYIFVKPESQERDAILTLPGVVKYLRYNGHDAMVSQKEIDLIKAIIQKGYDISDYDGNLKLEEGDKIRVTQGPLKNHEGEFIRFGGDDYALLAFSNFGQTFKVKIPKQIIKKID